MAFLFTFPGYDHLYQKIISKTQLKPGQATISHFPDGETLVQLHTDIRDQIIYVLCGLDHPDQKVIALLFFANLAREFGAQQIRLIAPYLGYMRQDYRFNNGEAITSNIFAKFLSSQIDWLVTIDPHLHRHKTLEEIYTCKCVVIHATDLIAQWIKRNIEKPLLIGPDQESEQWVAEIATKVHCPFQILNKLRHGDKDVTVSIPQVDQYLHCVPILIDDIISTARTMINTIVHLREVGMQPPVCIGIHPIFAENAFELLQQAGASRIISCNTIQHPSNEIDVSGLISTVFNDH